MANTHYIYLPCRQVWMDMIQSGVKVEEYRRMSLYNKRVFEKVCRLLASECDRLYLRLHHYSPEYLQVRVVALGIGLGNPEWGAPANEEVYIYKLDRNDISTNKGRTRL